MAKRKSNDTNPFKTAQFKKLKAKWYAKLDKDGFDDIEQDEENLKIWESQNFQNRFDPHYSESVQAYYQLAGHFLYDHKFKNARDKMIWELHANGMSVRNIEKELKKKKQPQAYRRSIDETVRSLKKEMLDKYGKRDDKPKRPDLN